MSPADSAPYNPNNDGDAVEFGAGEVTEVGSIERNAAKEDREAMISERTDTIPKYETDDLAQNEVLKQRTRGVKNDAFKQEKDLDKALEQEDPEVFKEY